MTHGEFVQWSNQYSSLLIQIERVQNPELWQQYAAKRQQVQRNNPDKDYERTLWHGTAAHAVDSIIRRGFNRSYCGKNGKFLFSVVSLFVEHSNSFNKALVKTQQFVSYLYLYSLLSVFTKKVHF